MGDIGKFIDKRLIISDFKVTSKEDAIHLLVNKIFEIRPDVVESLDFDTICNEVLARENMKAREICFFSRFYL